VILPCQRALFDLPDDVAYLNCASDAPQLHAVRAAGEAALARRAQPWTPRSLDSFAAAERARALFGSLVGVAPDHIAIVPSASYGLAVAAANVAVAAGRRIVVLADQFPSNVYIWRDLAVRTGATVVTVPRPADGDWTAAVLAHLDERTAVAALPHCHWTDGSLLDLVRVGDRARAVGAALVVDGSQSVGALPLDVALVQPDFLVAVTYKWLFGVAGIGFLYAAPRHHEGRPLELNWITRAGSEDYTRLVDYRDEFAPGARRFDMGGRNNTLLMPMVIAGLEQVHTWGVHAIQETVRALTTWVADEASRLGITAVPPQHRAGHIIGLRFPQGVPASLMHDLTAANVFVSLRGPSLRVSPHAYNTLDDVRRLMRVLAATIP